MNALTTFDYADLDIATREDVARCTSEIRDLVRRAARDIIEIGERLLRVKAALGHGRFGAWLRAEFAWDERTAQRFMQVAERFKSDKLSDLEIAPSALYVLAGTSVPEAAREEALERAARGERIGVAEARAIVAANTSVATNATIELPDTELDSALPEGWRWCLVARRRGLWQALSPDAPIVATPALPTRDEAIVAAWRCIQRPSEVRQFSDDELSASLRSCLLKLDARAAQPLLYGIRDRVTRARWERDIPRVASVAALVASEAYAEAARQAQWIEDEELRQALVARYEEMAKAQASAPPSQLDDAAERAYARAEQVLAGILEKLEITEARLIADLLDIEFEGYEPSLGEVREALWEDLTYRARLRSEKLWI